MKFVVKCRYCGHSYIIDAKEQQEDFQCDNCGGQNSVEDVVERIEEPVIIEKEVIKTVVVKEEEPDIQTIKDFDIFKYDYDENKTSDSSGWQKILVYCIYFIIIAYVIFMQFRPEPETEQEASQRRVKEMFQEREDKAKSSKEASLGEETIQQWMQAMQDEDLSSVLNCYYLPEGAIYTEEDLKELIETTELKDLWGTDVKITGIDFYDYSETLTDYMSVMTNTAVKIENIEYEVDFSNGYSRYFTVEKMESGKMKIQLSGSNVMTDISVQTAMKLNPRGEEAILYIDDIRIDKVDSYPENEDGLEKTLYTIPYISQGEHIFKVRTSLGDLSMSVEVTEKKQSIVLDELEISEEQKQELEDSLEYQWNSVQQAALEYEDPYVLQGIFDKGVTVEKIEEIMKLIRMEQGLQGDYEGAVITAIRIEDTLKMVDYDTYIVTAEVDYQSLNEEHETGTCNSKLAITIDEDGYCRIQDAYDNKFFTLIEEP